MQTLKTSAWDGRVVFHTRPPSYGVYIEADEFNTILEKKYADKLGKFPALRDLGVSFGMMPEIEFHFRGDEGFMLMNLCEFWSAYKAAKKIETKVDLAVEWRTYAAVEVIREWVGALNAASIPVHDPAQVPEAMLTEEQRAELEDPESPLASPVKSSAPAS